MWICEKCETYNDDNEKNCVICGCIKKITVNIDSKPKIIIPDTDNKKEHITNQETSTDTTDNSYAEYESYDDVTAEESRYDYETTGKTTVHAGKPIVETLPESSKKISVYSLSYDQIIKNFRKKRKRLCYILIAVNVLLAALNIFGTQALLK